MILTTRTKLTLARAMHKTVVGFRSLACKGSQIQVRRSGILWDLDINEGIDLAIYLFGAFERGTLLALRQLIRPGDTVLDIGANIGAHTLQLAKSVGASGHVYAFEPTTFAFTKLVRNLFLNPELQRRTRAEQIMLTARTGDDLKGELYSSWPLKPEEGLHDTHQGRLMSLGQARAESLDDYVRRLGIDTLSVIKLDVDGHELPVLQGAKATLRRFKPAIVMELAPYVHEEEQHSFEDLLRLLRDIGYQARSIESGKPIRLETAYLQNLIPAGAGINIIAIAR